MTDTTLINKVYEIANGYDPDIDDLTSFQDIIKTLEVMKDKALKFEIIEASLRPEPELFPVTQSILDRRPTLRETQARQAAMRQGQL